MSDTEVLPAGIQAVLHNIAHDLHTEFTGRYAEPAIEQLVITSYRELATDATVDRWLAISTEKFARQRLRALLYTEAHSDDRPPSVLFLCVHNAGRSQMALGYFQHLAGDRAVAWSGGSEPGEEINSAAVEAMAEIGIDITQEFPKPWTQEFLQAADVVITMGCGDACPLIPGKRYEDWELDDPEGKTVEEIRSIRDEIGQRVQQLLTHLGVPTV